MGEDSKGAVGMSEYEGGVSLVYNVLRKREKDTNTKYFHYLMRSELFGEEFYRWGRGIVDDLWTTRANEMKRILVTLPSSNEQTRIAKYLDDKLALLDKVIEKKERQIELLKEKRNATISKQIVENTETDWKVQKIKHLVKSIESGIWGDNPLSNEDDIKCLRIADFDYDNFSYSTVETIRNNPNLQERKVLRKGDILMEKSGGGEKTPVGRAVLFSSDERMVCANFIDKIRVDKEKILPEFLVLYLSVLYAGRVNTKYIKQNTGIQNMDIKEYFGENISYPDIKTQKSLTEFVNAKISAFNKAVSDVEKTIETLKEFKTSLVSNVVTGKIKV
jgi:type I restriction enzyme S subunit